MTVKAPEWPGRIDPVKHAWQQLNPHRPFPAALQNWPFLGAGGTVMSAAQTGNIVRARAAAARRRHLKGKAASPTISRRRARAELRLAP